MLCLLLGLVCHVAWAEVTLPTVSTEAEMHYYRIKNFRTNKYAAYIGDNTQLAQTTDFTANTVWYVTADNGNYKLHNVSTDKVYAGVSSFTATGATVYIMENPYKAGYVCVSTTSNLSSNCWDDQSNHTKIGNYNPKADDNAGTSWSFEEVTSSNSTFTLHEKTSNQTFTGNCTYYISGEQKSITATTGITEFSLTEQAWNGDEYTATITFPFPVSKEGGVTNATFMANWIKSGVAPKKWQAVLEGDTYNVKVWKPENTPVYTELDTWRWAIYPQFANGAFTFLIKNIEADKYVYVDPTLESASGSKGYVTLQTKDKGTKFSVVANGNYINLAYAKNDGRILKLTTNSENDNGVYLGSYSGTHAGNHISCPALTNPLVDKEEFVNGGIYTFETTRGWMGATESCSNVISTAKTSHNVTGAADNTMFMWTVYKSNNGNYYLYNLGKQMFMGVQSSNNQSVPFAEVPQGKKLTFKTSGSTDYPFMFSTDNAGVVNHSKDYGDGLITWTGGWNNPNDDGSNHKVNALVITLTADELKSIADLVEAYDRKLPITAEVEGLPEGNPNTHYGSVIATNASTYSYKVLKDVNDDVVYLYYDGTKETTISFDREYRGFEFQGFYLDGEKLDDSFILTDELKECITEETPLVAKVKFNGTNEVTLFSDDDEFSYRIPAIATTSTGRLIAVSDYRHNLDDIGRDNHQTGTLRIDLVARTSDDNGKTWSEKQTIAEGTGNKNADGYDCAYGDAAIAAVGEKVLVMAAAGNVVFAGGSNTNHNRTVRIYSENNGESWTKEDISETLFIGDDATIKNGYTAFFGSGKLAVDTRFIGTPEKPRIYGAMLIRKSNGTSTTSYNNYAIYTDDFGLTWNILGSDDEAKQTPIASGDEPKMEILPNGQILLSVRRGGGRIFNVFTYGNDENDKANGIGTWNGNVNFDNGGADCNGETFCIDATKPDGTKTKLLLQSQPKGGGRTDVSIWYKEISAAADATHTSADIAANWTFGKQVSTQKSAYSAMTLQKDGKIGFFFEEAPCYDDNHTKGYSMVYIPLTINQITNGNYYAPGDDLTTERTINVVLTDAQGNEYRDQLTCALNGIAGAVTTKYPFITLGGNAAIEYDGAAYTYTNTVTLPFKVSNEETTVWHNIYWHGNNNNELVYLYGGASNDQYVAKVTPGSNIPYGNSDYNTALRGDNMNWAIYHAGNFTFTLKNKLTGKFVQVTSVASGNSQNAKFVADNATATAFEIVTEEAGQNYKGDYSLKATVNETVGYLCNTAASYGWATHFNRNNHQGGWATIVEAPDFEALIAEVNGVLGLFGDGLGQYSGVSEENLAAVNTAKSAMENASSVKLNTLTEYQGYTSKTSGCTLNMPQAGKFFRIRGISGNYIDATSIYDNASATTGQMSMKSADACNYNGTVFYLDEEKHLLNYATGTYVKQTREIAAVGDSDKGTWTFAESPRTGQGKYALRCTVGDTGNGTCLHDSDGNRADRDASNCGVRHDFALEEVTALPVTIGSVGYATLYAPVALEIPEGVAAYVGTLNDDETELTLTEVEDVIPAETGVVLYRAEGTASTTHHFDATDDVEDIETDFVGSIATIAKSGTPYTLQTHNGGVAFKRYTGDNISGFKAYLNLTTNSAEAQAIRIRFAGEEDDTTGIEGSVLDAQGSQLIYDLQGRRVLNPTKGMYIVNGKKVVIK